jgi:diguanylate cyclase (GGDEF)-like protein/PAS domain S-box-containing protein
VVTLTEVLVISAEIADMELLSPATSRRRSDRVSIAFPVVVAGIDPRGKPFSERTRTTTVSRFGCSLSVARPLRPEQKVHLRRIGTNEVVVGQVVGDLGLQADGHLYGVGTQASCEGLWGIRFSSSFYETLLDTMQDGVYFVNRDRKITYWNDGAQRLSGYTADEVVGKSCFDNLLGHMSQGCLDEDGQLVYGDGSQLAAVMDDGQSREAQLYLRHKDGHHVPVNVRALPMRNRTGEIVGAVEVFSDFGARRKFEKRVVDLEKMAFLDALTSLPNRRYLELKVQQAIEEHTKLGRVYGLLLFDLDRFKHVNDTFGHDAGDALLMAVSKTLMHGLRAVDIVGRWGGEEFLVLMPDADAVDLGDLAERCRVLIAESAVSVGSGRVSVTASIGATVLIHSDSVQSAIRRADELMYQSKHSGGDQTTAG